MHISSSVSRVSRRNQSEKVSKMLILKELIKKTKFPTITFDLERTPNPVYDRFLLLTLAPVKLGILYI